MRRPSAIRSAFVLGGALCSVALHADDTAIPPAYAAGVSPAVTTSPEPYYARPATPPAATFVAAGGETAPQAAVRTAPQGLRHCSIVGAVNRPGTYAGEDSPVLLSSLIAQAGGLTDQACGSVRILHAGQQEVIGDLYSAGPRVVPSESVIVVDTLTAGPHRALGDSQPYIDVACLQLCERPAVVFLNPAMASVPQLLQMLGQPPEAAAAVRILTTATSPQGQLSSGSVVIFDPRGLDQQRLAGVLAQWPLQDLVRVEASHPQQVASQTVELLHRFEERMHPADGPVINPIEPVSAETESVEPLFAPGLAEPPGSISAAASTTPAVLDAPMPAPKLETTAESEPERVQPASAVQLRSVTTTHTLPTPTETTSDFDVPEVMLDSTDAMSTVHAESDEAVPAMEADQRPQLVQFFSSIAGWALCGLAGWGVFSIWMRQHERRRVVQQLAVENETPKPTIALPSRSSLNQLIDNSLRLREEEAPVPAQTFHGRTVGFRYLIRSGPHPLQGPHFATARAQQPAAKA
ncbi:MAG: hypothetical protein JNG89_11645, partial [Planctomycetaceae bacterium]|nr:hypothetical protein [Planctomycetaceae bacterium]